MKPVIYKSPSRIWVSDGHVMVEAPNGSTLMMTPEVAIEFSRRLGAAGGDAVINKVMSSHERDGPK